MIKRINETMTWFNENFHWVLAIIFFCVLIFGVFFIESPHIEQEPKIFFVEYDEFLNYTLSETNLTHFLDEKCRLWYTNQETNIQGYSCFRDFVIEMHK